MLLKMFAYLIDKNEELQLFFKGMTMTSFEFTFLLFQFYEFVSIINIII